MFKAMLRAAFGKRPVLGEVFVFDDDFEGKNLFKKPPHKVKVSAVRNGWVKYELYGELATVSRSMHVSTFLFSYRRITQL